MLDIFDILGPVMIGPSSSHTAGAARIGAMARTLLGAPPEKPPSTCTVPSPRQAPATVPTGRWWAVCWA